MYIHHGMIALLSSVSNYTRSKLSIPIEHEVSLRYFANSIRYSKRSLASPYKIVWMDPSKIRHQQLISEDLRLYCDKTWGKLEQEIPIGRFNKYDHPGSIIGGEWDSLVIEFNDRCVYRSLRDHFVNDVSWEDTTLVQRVLEHIDRGEEVWGHPPCSTRKDVWNKCENIDYIYNEIHKNGYKSQLQIGDNSTNGPLLDEVTVNIGRDGDFLYNSDAAHRLTIAKLLEIESIPVQILVRHTEWQQIRERIAVELSTGDSEVEEKLKKHPDIVDLINREQMPT